MLKINNNDNNAGELGYDGLNGTRNVIINNHYDTKYHHHQAINFV